MKYLTRKERLLNEIVKKVKTRLLENKVQFNNWKVPSTNQLKLEFKVEHELKDNYFWDSEEAFLQSISEGDIISISPQDDRKISYRSRTVSKEDLLSLIRGYRSYPQFRNEETVEKIYEGFMNNDPMDLPIVIEFSNGTRRIFSGNTRMDIAFQLGIVPKVLLVQSSQKYPY
jgi:hypothetical protein